MYNVLNAMTRVNKKPSMMCSFEKFHERPYRGTVLPYMMPSCHKIEQVVELESKGDIFFYLNPGNGHVSDFYKILLSSSGASSYSSNVVWSCKRAPFMRE